LNGKDLYDEGLTGEDLSDEDSASNVFKNALSIPQHTAGYQRTATRCCQAGPIKADFSDTGPSEVALLWLPEDLAACYHRQRS
jgi:hypothetical protein